MAKNNLSIESYGEWASIEDTRWRKNAHGVGFSGQNGVLVIDEALKADGTHRLKNWVKSGIPVYRDADDADRLKVFTTEAKSAGKKILGFTQNPAKIVDANGEYYEELSMGVQTAGEIYRQWLPVEVAVEDIPARFGNTEH